MSARSTSSEIRDDPGRIDRSQQQNFILTGDQNIVDVAYQVRWNIKDPELYLFQLAEPEKTIQEVAAVRDARGRRARVAG